MNDDNTKTDFPGAVDDETLALLMSDAAIVLARAKLKGLARAVELSAVILYGRPAHGEPFVEDIAAALDASERLFESLGDMEQDKLMELGIDGNVAETGQAIAYCQSWGLDPGERLGNALRVIAREVDAIREFADSARNGPPDRVDSRNVALDSIKLKAEALLGKLGIRKVEPE